MCDSVHCFNVTQIRVGKEGGDERNRYGEAEEGYGVKRGKL